MKEVQPDNRMKEWFRFIQEGNLDALSGIYFHYYDLLFSYGLKHADDKQSVEDAIQDVFMNLIKSRKSIGEVKNLPGYLVSAFRRQLFSTMQKQKRNINGVNLSDGNFEYFKSDDHELSEKEDQEQLYAAIRQCIKNLSSKQQEILFLRFENNVSYEEIAGMLHISVDSCYKSVYRAIRTIRQEVGNIHGRGEGIVLLFLTKKIF